LLAQNEVLTSPIDAVVFDCDGTLSHIEGIDELAKFNGVGEQVARLTADAMGKSGLSPEVFHERLSLVKPTYQQVTALSQLYFQHKTPDIEGVLQALRSLHKPVFIVSAGLLPAVAGFGKLLAINPEHIFAVNIYFDQQGNYVDFDRGSPLVYNDGKRRIIQRLKIRFPRLVYVGDGSNDYAVYDLVTRFVGYGGAFYREFLAQSCQFYITTPSISALLPLCLTSQEILAFS
jgi:phosphoserine phosphatase